MKMESEIKERNIKPWKTNFKFEKENRTSLSFSWSLEKTMKKNDTHHPRTKTNWRWFLRHQISRWPAPVFTTNLFPIHSRQRADGMACDLVLSAQGAVSALCIDQVNGCIVAGVQEIIRWEETPYLRGVERVLRPPWVQCGHSRRFTNQNAIPVRVATVDHGNKLGFKEVSIGFVFSSDWWRKCLEII